MNVRGLFKRRSGFRPGPRIDRLKILRAIAGIRFSYRQQDVVGRSGYVRVWSVRISDLYRAVGERHGDTISWAWIGTRNEFDKLFR